MWRNPPGLPSWRLSDGHTHTPWKAQTQARVCARTHRYKQAHMDCCMCVHVSFILSQTWQKQNTPHHCNTRDALYAAAWGSYITNLTVMVNLDEWRKLYSEVTVINTQLYVGIQGWSSLCIDVNLLVFLTDGLKKSLPAVGGIRTIVLCYCQHDHWPYSWGVILGCQVRWIE